MLSLAQKYRPVLSTPFGRVGYRELAPSAALKPFVRCFWTEKQVSENILVIPDTCMDIIFRIGGAGSFFCALDERSFYSRSVGEELFGIRFYAWTAGLFSRCDFSESGGKVLCVEEFFDGASELSFSIANAQTFPERAAAAEQWLLKRLERIRVTNDILNAVDYLIESSGRAKIADICLHTAASPRQLERLFGRTMGVSPKTFSGLVRYQLLWREMALRGDFDILDAVEKFGYFDQAHLLNDFKKRHLMNPKQALYYANKYAEKLK